MSADYESKLAGWTAYQMLREHFNEQSARLQKAEFELLEARERIATVEADRDLYRAETVEQRKVIASLREHNAELLRRVEDRE